MLKYGNTILTVGGNLVGEVGVAGRVWTGGRDYSFYVGKSSPYHIRTPEQYAAFAYLNNGLWQTDPSCPAEVTAGETFADATVYIDNDLVFNADYRNNREWIEITSSRGHVNPPANDCTLLRLSNFRGVLDGQFNRIVGLFYHQPDPGSFGSIVYFNIVYGSATVKNLYFEHCSWKNYQQGTFAIFLAQSDNVFSNIQARNCRLVASNYTAGSWGSVQFGYLVTANTGSPAIYGCGLVSCDGALYDHTSYASYRRNGLHLAKSESGGTVSNDFNYDVNMDTFRYGYSFSLETNSNCIDCNVAGVSTQGTSVADIASLVTLHNNHAGELSAPVDENLRYIVNEGS